MERDVKPAPKIIKPGFRFHLSTLWLCMVAASIFFAVLISLGNPVREAAIARVKESALSDARKDEIIASIQWNSWFSLGTMAFSFLPWILGAVVAFSELWIRGRDARYANEQKSAGQDNGPKQ